MPRFVLLYHECPPGYARSSHWDLMLETSGVLATWALAQLPRSWEAAQSKTAASHPECSALSDEDGVCAAQLGEHRLAYLELEGPLSGDRGGITRIDAGTFEFAAHSPGEWKVILNGACVQGRVMLSRSTPDEAEWMLISYGDG